jgi:hypothetical protein
MKVLRKLSCVLYYVGSDYRLQEAADCSSEFMLKYRLV